MKENTGQTECSSIEDVLKIHIFIISALLHGHFKQTNGNWAESNLSHDYQ